MRRHRQTLAVIFALGILFVPPIAWGCEGSDMQNCSMSDCPMPIPQEVEGCHDSDASPDQVSSNCGATPEVWISCCDGRVDQEPAKVDSASYWDPSTTPLVILAEHIEIQPPSRPPDLVSEVIFSQQHELGRFTLLSSFLL